MKDFLYYMVIDIPDIQLSLDVLHLAAGVLDGESFKNVIMAVMDFIEDKPLKELSETEKMFFDRMSVRAESKKNAWLRQHGNFIDKERNPSTKDKMKKEHKQGGTYNFLEGIDNEETKKAERS